MESSAAKKKISQEYFDSIVAENVNDLEMVEEEAIRDACEQLKSQGADMSMICKQSMAERNALTEAVRALSGLLDRLEEEEDQTTNSNRDTFAQEAIAHLLHLQAKFAADLSFRCLATRMVAPNACAVFMRLLNSSAVTNATTEDATLLLDGVLKALDAYLCQQSDALDTAGLATFIRLTDEDAVARFATRPHTLQLLLKCVNTSCQMSESNRQHLVENGLCENLMRIIVTHKHSELVLCQVCQLIRSLLLDDDMRVEFGKSHEHAKYIASKLNGIDILLRVGLG